MSKEEKLNNDELLKRIEDSERRQKEKIKFLLEKRKEITSLFFDIFNMKYNGQWVSLSELEYNSNARPKEYQDMELDEVLFRLVSHKLESSDYKLVSSDYKFGNGRRRNAIQATWLIEQDNKKYIVPILFKWDCSNHTIIEIADIDIISDDDLFYWAIEGLTEHYYKFNYSKIFCEQNYYPIPNTTLSVPALYTNKIADIDKLIKETNGKMPKEKILDI